MLNNINLNEDKKGNILLVGIALLVVTLGVLSGWLFSGGMKSNKSQTAEIPGAVSNSKEAGVADESVFKDNAEGVLELGGISGEGTHHLVREGGVSQNVYLTSSIVDLSSFEGKKIKIWGQTIASKKAGWLMDVGKVKVTE